MLTPSFAFAVLCFVLLLLFFSGLPNLKICELPHSLKTNEPDRQNRLAVMLVTILYAFCAFWNLGNTRSPQTFVPMEERDVILRLPENCIPDRLVLFPGVGQGNYSIEYSNDAEGWYPQKTFTQDHVKLSSYPLYIRYALAWRGCTVGSGRKCHPTCFVDSGADG